MCPHIQEAQNGSHTIVVAGTPKSATKVLALKKQKLLPRNIVTKESILENGSSVRNHIKTYDGSEDLEDHLKIFQAAAKMEHWAMPTWFYMFNSTLTGNARVWFDDLPMKSIDSYDDLRKAFLENYLQQKKCIKDPVEIHNINQRNGKSTKEFVRRYKLECRDVKGAPECMKISGFMHGITNPELIKRLHDKIPKPIDEMMSVTAAFLRGRWRPLIGNERSRFHHGNRKPTEAELQKGELPKRTKDGMKTRQIHPSYKNTERNSSLRQREV
uniref:Reverse transcriptase domain-containing protein n=1 Tax=Tanacetum cinerariifolium TaxID=118510 RepID=A0A699JP68_TANCI|nr:reverse transcriptase domain-containing protein [Tanacetum cinerariifolium]